MASCIGFIKGTNIVLGAILVGIGLYSHIRSSWRWPYLEIGTTLYKMCQHFDLSKHPGKVKYDNGEVLVVIYYKGDKCPSIALEHYFVVVICSTFLISLGIIYHGATAAFLITAGITYGISTMLVNQLHLYVERMYASVGSYDVIRLNMLQTEKLVAMGLTFLLAVGHVTIAILLFANRGKPNQS